MLISTNLGKMHFLKNSKSTLKNLSAYTPNMFHAVTLEVYYDVIKSMKNELTTAYRDNFSISFKIIAQTECSITIARKFQLRSNHVTISIKNV